MTDIAILLNFANLDVCCTIEIIHIRCFNVSMFQLLSSNKDKGIISHAEL